LAALDERRRRERSFDTVGPQTGGLLYLLAVVGRARRVLDVGTGDGASALWLAAAMARTRGELVAVERDSARATAARAILRRAGLEGRVTFHLGDWERVRHRLGDGFGLALLDTDPLDRPAQFQPLVDRCAPGALVASRGMLDHAAELARYQALVRTHPSVAADIALGADDGLALALLRPSSRGAQARSAGG
jgi:predicted O-methyltransferase YrrM